MLRETIRLKPDLAEVHNSLANSPREQGRLEEAIAEFHKARDKAQTGSDLARLIERVLTALDH